VEGDPRGGEGVNPPALRASPLKGGRGAVFVPAEAGSGVVWEDIRIKPEVMRRIEALGRMNDRRLALVSAGDGLGLLELAAEYEAKGMPRVAAEIRKEASEL
jgi:hypothetical protein